MRRQTVPTDVTISIVNWNTRALLEQCLGSLSEGVTGICAKIVVVDNSSKDRSVEIVRDRFPQVTLVANDANLGFARGNNQAYAQAEGRYFLLLNPDTIVRPGSVAAMLQFLDKTPGAAGVTCKLVNPDGTFQRIYTMLPAWRYVLAVHTVVRAFWPQNPFVRQFYMEDDSFDRVVAVEQPSASCLMIRRAVFPGSVLFDERFPILFNDTDLYRRLQDHGGAFYYLPEGEVVHYRGAGGVGQMGDDGIIDYLICLVRYYRKHHGWIAASVLWILLTMSSILSLTAGIIKVILRLRTVGWLSHEYGRRFRLARGRERFMYPPGFIPHVPSWPESKGLAS
jgi:GT2 family glycosyltransferase